MVTWPCSDENNVNKGAGRTLVLSRDDIFRQILLTSSIRNVWRTVRRICIFISGLKGFKFSIVLALKRQNPRDIAVFDYHLKGYSRGFLLSPTFLTNHLPNSCSLLFLPVSWLPIVRELVGLGLTLLCLCLATSLSLVTIAIGWIAHRPLVGLTLLAAAAVPILLSRRKAEAANHRRS